MSRTIWKFDVPVRDALTIEIPKGSRLLCVHEQAGLVKLWADVDPSAPLVFLNLWVVSTGGDIPADSRYVGTAHLSHLGLVWHVYAANHEEPR